MKALVGILTVLGLVTCLAVATPVPGTETSPFTETTATTAVTTTETTTRYPTDNSFLCYADDMFGVVNVQRDGKPWFKRNALFMSFSDRNRLAYVDPQVHHNYILEIYGHRKGNNRYSFHKVGDKWICSRTPLFAKDIFYFCLPDRRLLKATGDLPKNGSYAIFEYPELGGRSEVKITNNAYPIYIKQFIDDKDHQNIFMFKDFSTPTGPIFKFSDPPPGINLKRDCRLE